MSRLATIGVYGFSLETFLDALREAGVRVVLDVRQRRGVRGSEYAWANAKRLQSALDDAGIGYRHLKELAPTTELRQLQYAEDDRRGVGKRNRRELAEGYVAGYTEILDREGTGVVLQGLSKAGTSALLCVERDPKACHRSLLAARVVEETGVPLVHLRPSQD